MATKKKAARRGRAAAKGAVPGLSARNQLRGVVASVRRGGILSEVVLRLPGGGEIVSVITTGSVRRLGLAPGVEATAVVKATEVMLSR